MMDFRIERHETPVSEDVVEEIWEMWQRVPEQVGMGSHISQLRDDLTNVTRPEERKLLYTARVEDHLAGTSLIWISRRDPLLCEFGLPATSPEFRRRGIGQALFNAPVGDFREMDGEAIFLGTNHPPAQRVYRRAGYRKLVGSITLVNILSGDTPEAYFEDYFRGLGPATVHPGEAADRMPAVPLVHSAHDWQVMDANVGSFSRRYSVHRGYAGQVGRFIQLLDGDASTFFAGRAGRRGKVVGLSTAVLRDADCAVDAFTHHRYTDVWRSLMEAAAAWGAENGATGSSAKVSVEDEEKRALFEDAGFTEAGSAGEFLLDGMHLRDHPNGRSVAAIRLERL